MGWSTITGIQGIQKGAQHAALWGANAECQRGEEMGGESYRWWEVCEEMFNADAVREGDL